MSAPHCWEDGPATEDGCSTSCMLKDKHEGEHEWTRDDQITITFSPSMKLPQAIAIVEPHVAERLRIATSRDRGAQLVGGSGGDADREFADALTALITNARAALAKAEGKS